MAIIRTQYITVAELNEILGVSTYTSGDLIKIYEASELLEYYMNDPYNEYDTSDAPNELKIATAYQLEYMNSNDDDDYDSSNNTFSLGKFSMGKTNIVQNNGEYRKIAPKARRYLIIGGLLRRTLWKTE